MRKVREVIKYIVISICSIGIVFCLTDIFNHLKTINQPVEAIVDDPDEQEIIDFIKSEYGITVELNMNWDEISKKYGFRNLEEKYPYNPTTEEDKIDELEILTVLKQELAKYSDEGISKIAKTIFINKQPIDITATGVTWEDGNAIMLWFYPEQDKYFLYSGIYARTANHEFFHCFDEYKYEADQEWDAIDEDCANISDYACTKKREERASVWGYWLAFNETPNTQKLELLKERYGSYLKA